MSWMEPAGDAVPAQIAQAPDGRMLNAKRNQARGQSSVEGAMKKQQRAAFGDLTNQARGVLGQRNGAAPANADKGDAKAAKRQDQENSVATQPLLAVPQPLGSQHSDKENDHVAIAMECEASPRRKQAWVDIDADETDPLTCASMAPEIMAHAFEAERQRRPRANFMGGTQRDLSQQMRGILVDWLVEVAQEYKLVSETLHLTIDYLDRFLSAVPIERSRLQLLGVTCMLLASKFEEIFAPSVEDFCFITENTYSRQQLLEMERTVLGALDFQLAVPTVRFFQRRFVAAAAAAGPDPDPRLDVLASYLTELALLDTRSARFLPSQLAAASVLLALFCLGGRGWNATLEHYTSYAARDLRECTCYLWQCYANAKKGGLPAVAEKYRSPKYGCISESAPPAQLSHALFA